MKLLLLFVLVGAARAQVGNPTNIRFSSAPRACSPVAVTWTNGLGPFTVILQQFNADGSSGRTLDVFEGALDRRVDWTPVLQPGVTIAASVRDGSQGFGRSTAVTILPPLDGNFACVASQTLATNPSSSVRPVSNATQQKIRVDGALLALPILLTILTSALVIGVAIKGCMIYRPAHLRQRLLPSRFVSDPEWGGHSYDGGSKLKLSLAQPPSATQQVSSNIRRLAVNTQVRLQGLIGSGGLSASKNRGSLDMARTITDLDNAKYGQDSGKRKQSEESYFEKMDYAAFPPPPPAYSGQLTGTRSDSTFDSPYAATLASSYPSASSETAPPPPPINGLTSFPRYPQEPSPARPYANREPPRPVKELPLRPKASISILIPPERPFAEPSGIPRSPNSAYSPAGVGASKPGEDGRAISMYGIADFSGGGKVAEHVVPTKNTWVAPQSSTADVFSHPHFETSPRTNPTHPVDLPTTPGYDDDDLASNARFSVMMPNSSYGVALPDSASILPGRQSLPYSVSTPVSAVTSFYMDRFSGIRDKSKGSESERGVAGKSGKTLAERKRRGRSDISTYSVSQWTLPEEDEIPPLPTRQI